MTDETPVNEKKTPWAGIATALIGGGLGLLSGGVGGVLFGLIGGALGGFAVESLVSQYGPQINLPGADPSKTPEGDGKTPGQPEPGNPPGRSTLLADTSNWLIKGSQENPFPDDNAASAVIPNDSTKATLALAAALTALQRQYGQPLVNSMMKPVNWAREAIASRPLPELGLRFAIIPGRWHTPQSRLDYARRAAANYETASPAGGPTRGQVNDVARALKNGEAASRLTVQERTTMQRMINEYSANNPSIFRRLWASLSSGPKASEGAKAQDAEAGPAKNPAATVDELAQQGGSEAAEPRPNNGESAKPDPPKTVLDSLAALESDGTAPAKTLGRTETRMAMDHFDAIDKTAARKSTSRKGNFGDLALHDSVKGTGAETILNQYSAAAEALRTARETLSNKKSWTEIGETRTAKQQALKKQMKARQAEMKTLREQFVGENKSNVDHINGLRASRRLDGLSLVQGSLLLADTYMRTDTDTPGRNAALALGYTQLTQSALGAGFNTAALIKPESGVLKRWASRFGVVGNVAGAGLNSFMLHEQWKSGTVTQAFSGSSSDIKTWDARAQFGSSSSFLAGDLASLGSRAFGTTSAVGGGLGSVAYYGNVVGLALLDAKLIYDDVEKYNEHLRVADEVLKGIQGDATYSAGIAGVRPNYIDIPGIPPQMNEYSRLYTSLKGLRPKDNYDPTFLDRAAMTGDDPRVQLRKYKAALEECVKTGQASSNSMPERARRVNWVCDSLLGHAGWLGDPEKVMKEFEVGAEEIYNGKTAEVAMAEFDGAMPNGTRTYIARFDDYERTIKPLEKTHERQITEFFKIPGIMRAINPETRHQGLMQLDIKTNSAEHKDFEAAIARGQALDDAKMAVINRAIETMSSETIRTSLGLSEKAWNERYGTGKSMKEKVDELLKANNAAGITAIAQEYVRNTGEARRAAQGWLTKHNFKKEMEYVESLIADDIKEKRQVGKGKADEYFRKNADFLGIGGDKWKEVDFSMVAMSSSYEDYKAKKLSLAPVSMLDGIRANTQRFAEELAKAKKDNESLLKTTGAELEAQVKELGGAFEDVEVTDEFGLAVMRPDGKGGEIPLTLSGRVKELDAAIKAKEESILAIRKIISEGKTTFESNEELEAKIEFVRQITLELSLAREVTIQAIAANRLQQADDAKKDYRDETLRIFNCIKEINPDVLNNLEAGDQATIDRMAADVRAKSEALSKLPEKVSVDTALNTETDFLKAHRNLGVTLKAMAEKGKDKRTGMAPVSGMPNVAGTGLTGMVKADQSTVKQGNGLESLVAMLQNDGMPVSTTDDTMPDSFTPDLPLVVQKKTEKGQLT